MFMPEIGRRDDWERPLGSSGVFDLTVALSEMTDFSKGGETVPFGRAVGPSVNLRLTAMVVGASTEEKMARLTRRYKREGTAFFRG
jgi:hypothetical protein